MAVFSGTIRSDVLSMDTGLQVILPYDRPADPQQFPCKVLYLLHGLGDSCAAWCRYTGIERYAREKGIAVIMPEVQRSFYTDMVYGINYFSYITDELPRLCAKLFQISAAREHSYIAGLSMGGYGALKCAFSHPDRYAGCASFSGAVDLALEMETHGNDYLRAEWISILGPELQISAENNLFPLARKLAALDKSQIPDIFFTCGRQDFLYGGNQAFKAHLEQLGLPFAYEEWDGDHTWDFWDTSVKMMLNRMFPSL